MSAPRDTDSDAADPTGSASAASSSAASIPYGSSSSASSSSSLCAICLDSPRDVSTLDCCRHRFCFRCIHQWATQISSTCPLCKATITRIAHLGGEEEEEEEDDDGDDDVRIVSRVGAPSASPPVALVVSIPLKLQRATATHFSGDDEEAALPDSIRNARCQLCELDDREDELLLCDGCDLAWHTDCVGLSGVPEGDFFCPPCAAAREEEEEEDEPPTKRRRLRRPQDGARSTATTSSNSRRESTPAAAGTNRGHLCRRRSSLSSLSVKPISSEGASFAADMAARLAGWTQPSRTSSAAQAARRRQSATAAASSSSSSSRSYEEPTASWGARQALGDLAKARAKFLSTRRQARQRQHASANSDWSSRMSPAVNHINHGRPVSSTAQSTQLARNNQAAMAAMIAEARRTHVALNGSASNAARPPIFAAASSLSSSSSVPLRRRIPKKTELVELRVDSTPPQLSPNINRTSTMNGSNSPFTANTFSLSNRSPVAMRTHAPTPISLTTIRSSLSPSSLATPPPAAASSSSRPHAAPPSSLARIASPVTTPAPATPKIHMPTATAWSNLGPSSSASPSPSTTPGAALIRARSMSPASRPASSTPPTQPPPTLRAPIAVSAIATSPILQAYAPPPEPALPPMLTFADFDLIAPPPLVTPSEERQERHPPHRPNKEHHRSHQHRHHRAHQHDHRRDKERPHRHREHQHGKRRDSPDEPPTKRPS